MAVHSPMPITSR